VTTEADRFGVSLTEAARSYSGVWDYAGTYRPLGSGDQNLALDVSAIAGYRPIPVLEVGAETAFGHQTTDSVSSNTATSLTGFGDTTLRVRWDALDEPMPYMHTALPWPSLTVVGSLRIPTAYLGRDADKSGLVGRTGSVGSSSSSVGLGAWETSLAVAFGRTFAERFSIGLTGELAYRFSDSSLGFERHLAPRYFVQLGLRYAPTPLTGLGLTTDLGGEGDVTRDGESEPATSIRLWTVGVYGYERIEGTGLRVGALVQYEPPIDGLSRNASRATSLSISLGYVVD
jgi:hypothetical protein